jgi:hypothetical protein
VFLYVSSFVFRFVVVVDFDFVIAHEIHRGLFVADYAVLRQEADTPAEAPPACVVEHTWLLPFPAIGQAREHPLDVR